MLVVIAALQVSEQIKDAGAYAGLASILGLAVLSLLYFGQARELKRLRDWAGRAPERTAELQGRPGVPPAPAPPPRRVVAQPVAAAPAVRSRPQAPATAAGARPTAGQPVTAAGAPAVPVTPPRAAPGTSPGVAPGAAGAGAPVPAGTPGPGASGAPATAAPGVPASNGQNGQETQSIPAVGAGGPPPGPPRGAPATPNAPGPPPAAAAPPGPFTADDPVALRQGNAAGAPYRPAGAEVWPPADEDKAGRPGGRTIAAVLGVTTAVLLLALLGSWVLGGGDDPARAPSTPAASTSTDNEFVPPAPESTDAATPPVDPGDYAVYVLNGTQQNGFAAEIADALETDGFRTAGAVTAEENTVTTTEVFYVEGKKRGADAVAETLDVDPANVKKVTPAIEAQGPEADVIVQMGADKATP